jgi:hypothetical protein
MSKDVLMEKDGNKTEVAAISVAEMEALGWKKAKASDKDDKDAKKDGGDKTK